MILSDGVRRNSERAGLRAMAIKQFQQEGSYSFLLSHRYERMTS